MDIPIMCVVDDISRLIEFLRDPSSGTRLSQDEYGRDFADRLWLGNARDTWKLERMQFYDETGFPSWDAFAEGDWDRSMQLYDEMQPELEAPPNKDVPKRVVPHNTRLE